MSRILILIIFLLWLACDPSLAAQAPPGPTAIPGFFGFYLLLILSLGLYARSLARQVTAINFDRSLRRFHWMMDAARILIPAWFAVGVFFLGWRWVVEATLAGRLSVVSLPGLLLGTLPAFAAWAGLWWAQFPADQALREQNILSLLDAGLPHHAPPRFRKYFLSNLRLQLMFLGVPMLLIVLGHDISDLIARLPALASYSDQIDVGGWLVSAGIVFFFAPEIVRRVLHTEPLPNSPLRERLDALCRRSNVRYRDVLLWKTDHNMGNAAVMGFTPRFRYILLSDLLLERMPDEEIEAVFAHELGHIVHRHMAWYVVFVVVLTLLNVGPGRWLAEGLTRLGANGQQLVVFLAWIAKFLILFGFISRRFERQADVYAARTIQMHEPLEQMSGGPIAEMDTTPWAGHAAGMPISMAAAAGAAVVDGFASVAQPGRTSYVGRYGAAVFTSALRRVANVNNIPIAARSWCHGSIAKRMQYLQTLSRSPERTSQFDRWMLWLYGIILAALAASIVLFVVTSS